MSINRWAARRDQNEDELVKAARNLGAMWFYGPPLDGWCWHAKTGWVPVENKSVKGYYTERQEVFIRKCRDAGAPTFTWYSIDDVLKSLLGAK